MVLVIFFPHACLHYMPFRWPHSPLYSQGATALPHQAVDVFHLESQTVTRYLKAVLKPARLPQLITRIH